MSFAIIYITHESEAEARRVSDHLLEEKLVACANIFSITSAYWWEGDIQYEGEWVSIVKTIPGNWTALQRAVEEIHPYEVPCIMKIEAEANAAYEKWIRESVERKQ